MLFAVFLLIAVRQVGRFNLRIWQIMLGGAVAVLVTGQITPADALRAVNGDVMVFLFGMFVVGEALTASGYLAGLAHRIFRSANHPDHILLVILFGGGFLSAFLMNDTLAIIGTPLVLALAAQFRISPKLLLLTLALAITTGSAMSPVGNPQNLLVAVNSGMEAPFVTFFMYLLVPTLINLGIAFILLRFLYRTGFRKPAGNEYTAGACDRRLAILTKVSIAILAVLAAANIIGSLTGAKTIVSLPMVAICAAAPVLIFSEQRFRLFRQIDWPTLVFFAAMFVLMESVWLSGFFQSFIESSMLSSVPMILVAGVLVSQVISNVPFVALFQPMIQEAGGTTVQLMALAAGSTIAGNLTILGAASNVIIIQKAEQQGETLTFAEFAKVGVPLTLIQAGVYWAFLACI